MVFTGDLDGNVLAFSATDGHALWHYAAGAPIGGGVITYQVDGTEYLAVAVGINSPTGWKLESPPARVLVFKLR